MRLSLGLLLVFVGTSLEPWAALPWARSNQAAATITVEFLDVGQGDATLIRSPEGKTVLIDAGPPQDGFVAMLKKRGVKQLDLLVASHHHTDHIGNMAEVIDEFKPKAYLDSNSSHSTKKYQGVLRAVAAAGSEIITPFPDKERRIELGSVLLRVFPQPPEDEEDENNNSVGLRVQFGDFSVLLTGDSREEERAWWIKNVDEGLYAKSTVLLLPLHGGIAGIDWEWLQVTAPKAAIASSGSGTRYGPHLRTIKMLARAKADLYRTDRHGTITITSDGKSWNIVKEKGD